MTGGGYFNPRNAWALSSHDPKRSSCSGLQALQKVSAVETEKCQVSQSPFGMGSEHYPRQEPLVLDHDILNALEGLRRSYEAEQLGRTAPKLRLGEQAREVFDAVQEICNLRLGKGTLEGQSPLPAIEPVSCSVMIECLKRLEKSARLWTKKGRRRGYVEFVAKFMP